EDAGFLHLQPQVVALARALAHAAERGKASVLLGEVVDQLLDQHGLSDSGASEQTDLAALGVGGEQVDDLDPGLEHLGGGREVLDARRVLVDASALDIRGQVLAQVDWLAEQVEDAPKRGFSDRHGDRAAGVDHLQAARQAVGGVHRHGAYAVVAEVLLNLAHEHALAGAGTDSPRLLLRGRSWAGDRDGVVDLGQSLGKDGLDHDALDLLDAPDVALGGVPVAGVRLGAGWLDGGAGVHLRSILLFI